MSVSVSGINPLRVPQEIWSRVFSSYLPLEDRKNVRLTCRRFYDACCTHQIQRNEEMVFYGNFNTHRAIRSLCDSGRKLWNIKLRDVHLMDDSVLPFFEKHGAEIHSLTLVNCLLKGEILRGILGPCSNLQSFTLIYTIDEGRECYLRGALLPEFEELQKRGILCTKVTDLTLELISLLCRIVTNKQLLHIFAIFPNIKKLNLTVILVDHEMDESRLFFSDVTHNEAFSIACIYHQLEKIRQQLEELSLNIWQFGRLWFIAYEILEKVSSLEMKNLRKLSTNCNIISSTKPFPNLQHLTNLNCVILHDVTMPISAKVLLILNSATKLDSLTIKVIEAEDHPFMMCKECFVALVKSQLKTLNFWRSNDFSFCPDYSVVRADVELSSLDHSLLPNYTLNHLRIQTDDSTLMFLFSKYFLCLENMFVKNAREDILYNIFNYQMKLRSLALYHCERYPLSRIRPKDNPFERRLRNLEISLPSQLDNLTHLRIVDNISLDLSQFMLNKFVFSKLRSLTIQMEDVYPKMNCDIEALWQTIKKSTQLEYLVISWRTVATFQQWFKLFESLPKLRHFSCTDSCLTLFDNSKYRQLFHTRSSLRSVYHHSKKKSESIRCVYDIITNSVEFIRSGTGPKLLPLEDGFRPFQVS